MRAIFVVTAGVGLLLAASPALANSDVPITQGASAAADTPPAPRYSDDRVILRFRAGVEPNARQQAFNEVGVEDSDSLGKRFQLVTLDEGVDIKQAIAEFKANPDVIDAVRDGYADLHGTNDPLYDQLWGPAPVVAGVDPASGPTDGGTLITVTGSGFYANTTATVGGQPCASLSVLSPTSLTCATPAGAAGAVPVAVRNADDRSGVRDAAFTYVAPITPVVKDEVVVGKVSGLRAKRIKAGKDAKLSWAAASNAVRYEFGCVAKGKKLTKWTSVTATKARCTGLKPSKTYRGFVRAVGEANFSPAVSVKIRPKA